MKLLPTTTEAEILVPVTYAREVLAKAAANDYDSDALLGHVHALWAAEAVSRLRWEIVCLLSHYDAGATTAPSKSEALNLLFVDHLSRGADDTWSGRKNDARRHAFDAVRREIADLRWSLTR